MESGRSGPGVSAWRMAAGAKFAPAAMLIRLSRLDPSLPVQANP